MNPNEMVSESFLSPVIDYIFIYGSWKVKSVRVYLLNFTHLLNSL